jgi:hypothetical protein
MNLLWKNSCYVIQSNLLTKAIFFLEGSFWNIGRCPVKIAHCEKGRKKYITAASLELEIINREGITLETNFRTVKLIKEMKT